MNPFHFLPVTLGWRFVHLDALFSTRDRPLTFGIAWSLCEKWVFTQRAFIEETAGHTHLLTSTPLFSPAAINVSLRAPRFPRESIQLLRLLCNPATSSLIWDAWAHIGTSCLHRLYLAYYMCNTWLQLVNGVVLYYSLCNSLSQPSNFLSITVLVTSGCVFWAGFFSLSSAGSCWL